MRGWAALLAVLAAGLTGCADPRERPSRPPSQDSPGTLVSLTRDGRVPYAFQRIVVRRDGRALLTRSASGKSDTRRLRLIPATVRRLTRQLNAARFAQLPARLRDDIPAQDAYRYAITHAGHTVERDQTNLPPELRPVVAILTAPMSPDGGGAPA
jgi:hypothetical protein